VQLRYRTSLQLLSLQLLAAMPEVMRQPHNEAALIKRLAARENTLRKNGLPLLHDKLTENFLSVQRSAGQRGAEYVIAALAETLQQSRQKWVQDTQRSGAELDGANPEDDLEQMVREANYERSTRVSLLYYAAHYYYSEANAKALAGEHSVLVLQEQHVDRLCTELRGSGEETTAALALFWLDAVDLSDHMHIASLLLCRSGVSGVLGSLRISSYCHALLSHPARHATPSSCPILFVPD